MPPLRGGFLSRCENAWTAWPFTFGVGPCQQAVCGATDHHPTMLPAVSWRKPEGNHLDGLIDGRRPLCRRAFRVNRRQSSAIRPREVLCLDFIPRSTTALAVRRPGPQDGTGSRWQGHRRCLLGAIDYRLTIRPSRNRSMGSTPQSSPGGFDPDSVLGADPSASPASTAASLRAWALVGPSSQHSYSFSPTN